MKRFLSVLLTVAMLSTMFAGLTVWADTATVVGNFIDLDFNDWESRQTTDKNGNSFSWAFTSATSPSIVTDAEKGDKVLKFDSTNTNTYAQLRHDLTGRDYFTREESQWMEWSVKFEGGFAKVGYDHNNGLAPIHISANGELRRFANNTAVMYQFELGKWYHIVALMDTVNAPTNDGGRLYVWVNGEKVFNGGDYNSGFKVQDEGGKANWKYYRFYVNTPAEGANVYIDNVKAYSTGSGVNDTRASDAWNFAITDEKPDDGISIVGEKIVAPGKTVAQVKAAFTGVELVAVDANDEDAAEGKNFYVWAANDYAYKTLKVADVGEKVISKSYVDIDFEKWSGITTNINADGTAPSGTTQWVGTSTGSAITQIAERGGKSLAIPVSGVANTGSYYRRVRFNMNGGAPSTFASCGVLWTEFSVKYEGGFAGVGHEYTSAISPFMITNDGTLAKNIKHGYQTSTGTAIGNYQLELGKWYHFVVALDFTDSGAAADGAPFYLWMNGEPIETGTSRSDSFKTASGFSYNKIWIDEGRTPGSTVYLDNIRIYETLTVDTWAEKDFEINVTDANNADEIYIDNSVIVAPETATVNDIKVAIAADNYVFVKEGAVLEDEAVANGSVVTVNGTSPVAFKQYDIAIHGPIINRLCPAGSGAVTYVSTNISSMSSANSIERLTDNDISKEYQYKSNTDIDSGELKVMINLDGIYTLSKVIIHERYVNGANNNVTVQLGKDGVLTKVVDDKPLTWSNSSGANLIPATEFNFTPTEADTIIFTFRNTNDYDVEGYSTYEIAELEAYGYKSGDVSVTGIVPSYSFGSASNREFVIGFVNGTDSAIEGQMLIAAYEEDELVAVSSARPIKVDKGSATAEYTKALQGIIQEGRTYKVFVWDNFDADHPRPFFKSELITK